MGEMLVRINYKLFHIRVVIYGIASQTFKMAILVLS